LDRFLLPLRANAISVASNGGNGHLGHLALVVNPDVYEDQSGGIAFVAPANPGTHPVHPENATGPQITEINRSHLARKAEFKEYTDTGNALKALIIVAVPEHFQLVPPGVHRANAAERSIRTFKNHFNAGLCSTDPDFPVHLWDRLLDQAVLTLNLMRGSRINPKLSAWAQVHGQYDSNKNPIAPPGTRVLVHVKPTQRSTWSPHAEAGWYIGPTWEHYRCYRVWMTETARERTPDTVTWFPQHVKMPIASSVDLIVAAAHDLIHALKHPSPGSALAPLTDSERGALSSITEILLNRDPVAPAPLTAPENAPVLRVTAETAAPPNRVCFADPIVTETPIALTPFALPATTPTVGPSPVHATNPTDATPMASRLACPARDANFEPTPTWTTVTRKLKRGGSAKQTPTMATLPPTPTAASVLRVPVPTPDATHAPPPAPTATAPALRVSPPTPSASAIAPNKPNAPDTPNSPRRRNRHRSPPRHTNHHRQPIRRSNRNRRPSRKQRESTYAALSAMACPDCCPDPDSTLRDDITHAAHAALNVDTGELSEYQALLKSSDGPLWERSCTEEIARLAQGFPAGGIPESEGTNPIFFIPVSAVPKDRKQRTSASAPRTAPRKSKRVVSASPSVAIASSTPAKSAPKPPVSPPPKCFSTASYPPRAPSS
jgi:hypothetical protein